MRMLFKPNSPVTYGYAIDALADMIKEEYNGGFNYALRILSNIINIPPTSILLDVDMSLSATQLNELNHITNLIYNDFPISYIISNMDFYNENYILSKDCLIPRPETELLVDLSLDFLTKLNSTKKTINCLEIGTGTGCISISILNNIDLNLKFIATDISEPALKVARKNADRILAPKKREYMHLKKQDFLKTPPTGLFDLIVSNPPYISLDEYRTLPKSVRYEPQIALTDDNDGLVFYEHIADLIDLNLTQGGRLIVEIHSEMAQEVKKIFTMKSRRSIEIKVHKDIFERDRAIEVISKAQ